MRSLPELPDESSLKRVLLSLNGQACVSSRAALRYEVLDDRGLRLLCQALQGNTTVTSLRLIGCRYDLQTGRTDPLA